MELGYEVAGNRVNEVARIKELSKQFDVEAYFISGSRESAEQSKLLSFWFERRIGNVHLLPSIYRVYGTYLLWIVLLSIVVCLEILVDNLTKRIDLVITRVSTASLPILLLCKIMRIPSLYNTLSVPFSYKQVSTLGGIAFQNPISRNIMKVVDYACLSLAGTIAVSGHEAVNEIRSQARFVSSEKVVQLPFPLPEFFFKTLPHSSQDKIVLKFLGSLNDMYDFSPLIEAVAELNSEGLETELIVSGSGKQRKPLEELVKSRNISNVQFKEANLPRSQIPRELSNATAVVIPLRDSVPGVPIKGIEAMALGIPVIISNVKDLKTFINGKSCIVVKQNNKAGWKEGIMQIGNPLIRGKIVQGAKAVAEQYRPGKNIEAISAIIKNLQKVK